MTIKSRRNPDAYDADRDNRLTAAQEAADALHIETVPIPAGTFEMGSTLYEDSQPIHTVTIAPFEMGKYPVTQAQWRAVMGNNPSHFKGSDLPVDSVSWKDAQEFCRKLSEMTGKHYRLPTEAEWEYAARAGGDGDRIPDLDEGWYWENSDQRTHPVGEKKPNSWGLYDVHGNVWEWVEDPRSEQYGAGPDTEFRLLRGGSWFDLRDFARAVYRLNFNPHFRDDDLGFRVVVRPPSGLPADSGVAAQVLLCRPPLRVDTNRLVTR